MSTISVIIPAYNEERHITKTIGMLRGFDAANQTEIIVVDGGSHDMTVSKASEAGAIVLTSPRRGRAAQMNFGAKHATGSMLYFLHADTLPPPSFIDDLFAAERAGYRSGCFMLAFDHAHWFLRTHCWFTRFNINYFRFGDQSLFVQRDVFEKCGGYDEKHILLEDQEIISRLKKTGRFTVIPKPVITSARKYRANGVFKTQGVFYLIYFLYTLGYSQEALMNTYRKLIKQ